VFFLNVWIHFPDASKMSTGASEYDWLFDYIVSFLKSPPWTTPLNSFIDENCIIFDSDEENKLSYTECHQRFIELIDQLLESNLSEIGVTQEQFVEACVKGQNSAINNIIFGQLLAVDDFLTFKKMMVKRNVELELEAMKELQAATEKQQNKAKEEPALPASAAAAEIEKEYERELAEVLRLSEEQAKQEQSQLTDAEAELQAVLAASMADYELAQQEARRQEAELEHAIAMSIAIQSEQLKQIQLEEEEKKSTPAAETAVPAAETAIPAAESSASAAEPSVPAAESSAPAAEAAVVAEPEAKTEAEIAPSVPEPTSTPVEAEVAPIPTPAVTTPAVAAPSSLPALVPRQPLKLVGHLPALANAKDLAALSKRAEEEFRRNQAAQKQRKDTTIAAVVNAASSVSAVSPATVNALSEAELKRRQQVLRAQRELLLKKKNQERAASLADFRAEQVKAAEGKTQQDASAPSEEDRKQAMRDALAARLKASMLAHEHDKESVQLSEQLRRAEQLRAQQEAEYSAKQASILAQQKARQEALNKFHQNLANNKVDGAKSDFTF